MFCSRFPYRQARIQLNASKAAYKCDAIVSVVATFAKQLVFSCFGAKGVGWCHAGFPDLCSLSWMNEPPV